MIARVRTAVPSLRPMLNRSPLVSRLVAVTGSDDAGRPTMSTFLVDLDTPGVALHDGYRNVSHRGYTNSIIDFDDVHVDGDALLGEEIPFEALPKELPRLFAKDAAGVGALVRY